MSIWFGLVLVAIGANLGWVARNPYMDDTLPQLWLVVSRAGLIALLYFGGFFSK